MTDEEETDEMDCKGVSTGKMGDTVMTSLEPDSNVDRVGNSASHGTTLLDLPTDILLEIFDYYHPDAEFGDNDEMTSLDRMHVIQNARLVCRRLHQIASRHLCGELSVRLDQASLDHACRLLENPLISAGVRGIRVVLEYRPREIAVDISRFAKLRLRWLRYTVRLLEWSIAHDQTRRPAEESRVVGSSQSEVYAASQDMLEIDRVAVKNYKTMLGAWDEFLDDNDDIASEFDDFIENDDEEEAGEENNGKEELDQELSPEEEQEASEYRQILLRGHKEYAEKHIEQYRLVKDGIFASKLASSIAKLQNPIILTLTGGNRENESEDATEAILADKAKLPGFLLRPSTWEEVWKPAWTVTIDAIKVLSDLPIALTKEGVTIQQLKLFCFPETGSYYQLNPSLGSWEDLKNAFEHLELFHMVGLSVTDIEVYRPSTEGMSYLDKYVGAAFLGQSLESIRLEARCIEHVELHSVFQSVRWPRMKDLTISNFSLNQADIVHLCAGITTCGRIHKISLSRVLLREGEWEEVLTMLRGVAVQHECQVEVSQPGGQGLETDNLWNEIDSGLQADINAYLSGYDNAENPLVEGFRPRTNWGDEEDEDEDEDEEVEDWIDDML